MHDIGKVRTPIEILGKPEKLTDAEFAIMRMHVVDGAEILRGHTRDARPGARRRVRASSAPRRNGLPSGHQPPALNLGTMLCSIADVHDAMRSQRAYQESFPTDRILAVLKRNDGMQFDQHLVRRFSAIDGDLPAREPGTARQRGIGRRDPHLRAGSLSAQGPRHCER